MELLSEQGQAQLRGSALRLLQLYNNVNRADSLLEKAVEIPAVNIDKNI